MKKYLLTILLISSVSQVCSREVPVSEITYIGTWTDHIDIKMDGPAVDAGCGEVDLYRIDLVNDPAAEKKYSALLAAFLSGKKVGLNVSSCVGNRGRIQGVRLSK